MSGYEPSLGGNGQSGNEPMLGGGRRAKIDRDLFWDLLQLESVTRLDAVNRVIDQGAARYYGRAMRAVLSPDAKRYKAGRIWKVPYSYYHKLAAMDSLIRLDPTNALGGLISALKHDDVALQQAAISCISRLSDTRAEKVLVDILDDHRTPIRTAAINALADRWSLSQIRRLSSQVGSVVADAAQWLGANEGTRVLPILRAVCERYRPTTVNEQIAQCGLIDGIGQLAVRFPHLQPSTLQFLRDILNRHAISSRPGRQAIEVLKTIGTEEALATIIVYRS